MPLGSRFGSSRVPKNPRVSVIPELGLMVQREWLLAWQELAVAHPKTLAGKGEGRLVSWYLDSDTEINSFVLPSASRFTRGDCSPEFCYCPL